MIEDPYHSPAPFIPVPANIFPTKLAPNVPYNILRNPPFCSFALFSFVSLTPYNNKPESSRDLTILIMSSISSFDIINAVLLLDPKSFVYVPVSAPDATAVNPNGIKTLLANGLIIFFINGDPVFGNRPRSLPKKSSWLYHLR